MAKVRVPSWILTCCLLSDKRTYVALTTASFVGSDSSRSNVDTTILASLLYSVSRLALRLA